jgi:hypothetical protein
MHLRSLLAVVRPIKSKVSHESWLRPKNLHVQATETSLHDCISTFFANSSFLCETKGEEEKSWATFWMEFFLSLTLNCKDCEPQAAQLTDNMITSAMCSDFDSPWVNPMSSDICLYDSFNFSSPALKRCAPSISSFLLESFSSLILLDRCLCSLLSSLS